MNAKSFVPIGGCLIVALASCSAGRHVHECELPPLSEAEVRHLASNFLAHQDMNPKFRALAESRVRAMGCRYHYEEAEKLDYFGVGVIVEIDRAKHVVDFWPTH